MSNALLPEELLQQIHQFAVAGKYKQVVRAVRDKVEQSDPDLLVRYSSLPLLTRNNWHYWGRHLKPKIFPYQTTLEDWGKWNSGDARHALGVKRKVRGQWYPTYAREVCYVKEAYLLDCPV